MQSPRTSQLGVGQTNTIYMKNLVIVYAIIFLVYGCFYPSRVPDTPKLEGQIIDKLSRAPIKGAKIYFKKYPKKFVETDSEGIFKINENRKWYLQPIGAVCCPNPPKGTLLIEAKDYNKLEYEIDIEQSVETLELKKIK